MATNNVKRGDYNADWSTSTSYCCLVVLYVTTNNNDFYIQTELQPSGITNKDFVADLVRLYYIYAYAYTNVFTGPVIFYKLKCR
jgi:hypothetical protein